MKKEDVIIAICVVICILLLLQLLKPSHTVNIQSGECSGYQFIKGDPCSGFVFDRETGRCYQIEETNMKSVEYRPCVPKPQIIERDGDVKK